MAETTEPAGRGGRLGYLPGVDGLRAIAVSAVFLFHADVVPGGFLGVDVFFVISGFLITALAIGEIERTGSLSLGRFWGRRARRLLPALYLLVAAVVVWAIIDGVPEGLGRDVAATLAYVANWVRVGDGYEYFAAYDQPSLLEHAWSLAVEEQFYLVWPALIVVTLAATRRTPWSPRVTIGAVAAVGVTRDDRSSEPIVVEAPAPVASTSESAVTGGAAPPTTPLGDGQASATSAADADVRIGEGPATQDASVVERRVPPDDRPLRLLVVGDSIAESLKAPEILDVSGTCVEVVNRSVIACPVTWAGRWAFDGDGLIGDPPECGEDERLAGDVAEVDPDVVLLMFEWAGTIAGRELPDGTVVAPCEPGFDDRFGAQLTRLVDRFDADFAVVVATVTPPSEFHDESQSDRPGCLNRLIREGGFDVFDFGDWLCPRGDCTNALPLRRDTVHYADSPDVRAFVWPTIITQVLDAGGC